MSTLRLDITLDRPGFRLEVNHDIALRGITALFGPSGSGKTTLLRSIAGLERDVTGTIRFDDEHWQSGRTRWPAHRRRIGYVFQDSRLFPHLTVEGNLRFALNRAAGVVQERSNELAATVAAMNLEPLLPRRVPSLSGGERQRVAIARALLTKPKLLLMDEPLSSLDIGRKREIVPLIEALPLRFNVPVLYVTHNLDEVARLAGDMLLLAEGRVAAHGTVVDVLERLDLGTLTGGADAGIVLRAEVTHHHNGIATLDLGAQQLRIPMAPQPAGATRQIRIHARDVAIATSRPRDLSIRNVLAARILKIETGSNINVELLLDVDGQHLRSRITRDAADELKLATGQQVFALIKSVALENSLLS